MLFIRKFVWKELLKPGQKLVIAVMEARSGRALGTMKKKEVL